MGCINSKKDINDVHPNIFHVINIDDDGTALWNGQLEVSRTELTLYRKGKEPTKWPLKCLRRYGYNVDQFSFEAGRRCTTGEGIYAFRCRRAETLFYTVQSYIQGRIYSDENSNPNDPYPIPVASSGPSVAARSVSQNNTATRSGSGSQQMTAGTFVINRTGIATSQSLSPNGTIHSNSNQSRSTDTLPMDGTYLEPTPNRTGVTQPQTITTRFQQGLRLSSVSSGPISPDITSPGSPNSMTNILEVTTLNPLPTSNAGGGVHQGVSNLYQEFPMKDNSAMMAALHHPTMITTGGNRISLDIPPQELAPSTGDTETLAAKGADGKDYPLMTPDGDPTRMYMNVNITPGVVDYAAKAKKMIAINSKSNSSLISIATSNNINNNTGSFDEGQYQNVKTPTSTVPTGSLFAQFQRVSTASYPADPNRFYENLEPAELSRLLRGRCSKPDIFTNVDLPLDHSEPCTPTTTTNRKVNYIVLDLDQSNSSHSICAGPAGVTSPTGTNPASNNNNPMAINFNNLSNNANPVTPGSAPLGSTTATNGPLVPAANGSCPVVCATGTAGVGLLPPESPKKASLGYATIDFNKTVALSNSTTPSSELDSEGSRKTRHNSTVTSLARQSNSVSD